MPIIVMVPTIIMAVISGWMSSFLVIGGGMILCIMEMVGPTYTDLALSNTLSIMKIRLGLMPKVLGHHLQNPQM